MKQTLIAAVKKITPRIVKDRMKEVLPYVPWQAENKAMRQRFDPFDTEYALNTQKRDLSLIVSFTTIPSRIDKAIYVADSMLSQTVRPDKVLLYLAEDEFPDKNLPGEYANLMRRGLEINYVENLKPHKKYYFTLRDYPDAILITVDDDIIYPLNLIEALYDSYKKFPDAISALRAHRMRGDKESGLLPYMSWELGIQEARKPGFDLFPTGVGSVLYPPCSLSPEVMDKETLIDLCLCADDVWLKAMSLLNDTPVVLADSGWIFPTIFDTQEIALQYENTSGGKNDEYINQVFSHYHLLTPEFLSKVFPPAVSGSGKCLEK